MLFVDLNNLEHKRYIEFLNTLTKIDFKKYCKSEVGFITKRIKK